MIRIFLCLIFCLGFGSISQAKSLCHKIGKKHTAVFTGYNGKKISKRLRVGGSYFCHGRCGRRCPKQGRRGKYSQACLNHDACAFHFKTNWGPCADELRKAALSGGGRCG